MLSLKQFLKLVEKRKLYEKHLPQEYVPEAGPGNSLAFLLIVSYLREGSDAVRGKLYELAELEKYIESRKGNKKVIVLDLLSGFGFSSLFLLCNLKNKKENLEHVSVYLVDNERYLLDYSKELFFPAFPKIAKRINYVFDDIRKLRQESDSASIILLNDYCLYKHLHQSSFKEIKRVLKKGGRIIVGASRDLREKFKTEGFSVRDYSKFRFEYGTFTGLREYLTENEKTPLKVDIESIIYRMQPYEMYLFVAELEK